MVWYTFEHFPLRVRTRVVEVVGTLTLCVGWGRGWVRLGSTHSLRELEKLVLIVLKVESIALRVSLPKDMHAPSKGIFVV